MDESSAVSDVGVQLNVDRHRGHAASIVAPLHSRCIMVKSGCAEPLPAKRHTTPLKAGDRAEVP